MLMCVWQGTKIPCKEYFTIEKTDNGFCCSFNALKKFLHSNENDNKPITKEDMKEFYDDYSVDEDLTDYFWGSR